MARENAKRQTVARREGGANRATEGGANRSAPSRRPLPLPCSNLFPMGFPLWFQRIVAMLDLNGVKMSHFLKQMVPKWFQNGSKNAKKTAKMAQKMAKMAQKCAKKRGRFCPLGLALRLIHGLRTPAFGMNTKLYAETTVGARVAPQHCPILPRSKAYFKSSAIFMYCRCAKDHCKTPSIISAPQEQRILAIGSSGSSLSL